jgi:hypothetical protein
MSQSEMLQRKSRPKGEHARIGLISTGYDSEVITLEKIIDFKKIKIYLTGYTSKQGGSSTVQRCYVV